MSEVWNAVASSSDSESELSDFSDDEDYSPEDGDFDKRHATNADDPFGMHHHHHHHHHGSHGGESLRFARLYNRAPTDGTDAAKANGQAEELGPDENWPSDR